MAVRKRFNAAERALITEAMKSDGAIQWQNVTQWHPGIITDATIVTVDGWQHIVGTNQQATDRLSVGQVIHFTPGHIRVA